MSESDNASHLALKSVSETKVVLLNLP
jgi:hypothetical protein